MLRANKDHAAGLERAQRCPQLAIDGQPVIAKNQQLPDLLAKVLCIRFCHACRLYEFRGRSTPTSNQIINEGSDACWLQLLLQFMQQVQRLKRREIIQVCIAQSVNNLL